MPIHLIPVILQAGAYVGAVVAGPLDDVAIVVVMGWWMRRQRRRHCFYIRPSLDTNSMDSCSCSSLVGAMDDMSDNSSNHTHHPILQQGMAVLQASGAWGPDGAVDKRKLQAHLDPTAFDVGAFLQQHASKHDPTSTDVHGKESSIASDNNIPSVDFVELCRFLSGGSHQADVPEETETTVS